MRRLPKLILSVCAASLSAGSFLRADAKVDEQVVAPAVQDAKYVVSLHGVHLATVAPKGSRVTVIVDGVAGPKFDSIVTPATSWVDPRLAEAASKSSVLGNLLNAAQPVTFSTDGSHYAYIGHAGEEWVVIEDGKELFRMPAGGIVGGVAGVAGQAGNTDLRIQFSSDDGKHLLVARSAYNGYELWVDGQKWPGTYGSGTGSAGTIDPLISPDGQHIAYMAQIARDKSALIIDGKEAGYTGENLHWTADSKHLISVSHSSKGATLQIDGKALFTAKGLYGVYSSPGSNHIIAVLMHQDPQKGNGQFLWVDGKPVPASLSENISNVFFSADGKHYAALCGKAGAQFMVVDGKKGQVYQMINDATAFPHTVPTFSDSGTVSYSAMVNGNRWFVVTGDDESDAFSEMPATFFSPDGKHHVIIGQQNQNQNSFFSFDGKATRGPRNHAIGVGTFTFSPDNSRYAGVSAAGLIVDGAETGLTGTFLFSPDSKHIAVCGSRIADNHRGIFIDGKLAAPMEPAILHCVFSPDSQHLFWMTREPAARKDAPPGTYEFVTYVDGKPGAHGDDRQEFTRILLPAGYGSFTGNYPAWSVAPDGSLSTILIADDGAKRVKLTPGPETSIATMLAEAEKGDKGAKKK